MIKGLKLNIIYLMWHLNYGGAEVGLLTTLRKIDKNCFSCKVMCIEGAGPIGEEIKKIGIDVEYLHSSARPWSLRTVIRLIKALKNKKIDILHTSLFYANFFGRIASFFVKIPVVVCEERSMYTEKKFYHVVLDRILSSFTDKIIVCSKSVLNFTVKQEKIKKGKFCLIYNAVDKERFDIKEKKDELRKKYGYSDNQFIVGTVGSLIPKKGHKFLIRAIADLKDKIPELKLFLVGDGEFRKELEIMAVFYKVKDNIEFLGSRSDIPELMKIMDIFVLPSLQEGFPRTLLEAMYSGLPVIASDISGVPEIIEDGKNGFLSTPGEFADIIDKINTLHNSPELKARIGSEAKKTIESAYLPSHYLEKLESVYEELGDKKCV